MQNYTLIYCNTIFTEYIKKVDLEISRAATLLPVTLNHWNKTQSKHRNHKIKKMKKLAVMALLLVGMTSWAQEEKGNRKSEMAEKTNWTPEQKRQLRVKELTLKLDLSAAQQVEMSKIIAEQQTKREQFLAERKANKNESKKLTSEEKFVMKNKMLDEKIALKARLKKILSAEQLEKYEKMAFHKKSMMKKRMHDRKSKMGRKG